MGEKEYLMIKLGSHSEADFYLEHSKVIKENGYVDMALLTGKDQRYLVTKIKYILKNR